MTLWNDLPRTGKAGGGTAKAAVTLYQLSLEYAQTAADLRRRIVELERAGREADSAERRLQLAGRARPLRSMYRDVRAVARHLEHYYDKHAPRRPAESAVPAEHGRRA